MNSATGWLYLLYYLALYVLLAFIFVLPIRNTFKMVAPHNRLINIKYIWFTFTPIPVVCNILFIFITLKVANSLALEYKEKGIPFKHKPTYQSALILGVISCVNYVQLLGQYTQFITVVFLIVYIIEIFRCGRVLKRTKTDI